MALLDPLGYLHLSLAREQAHLSHLAQIHAHRIQAAPTVFGFGFYGRSALLLLLDLGSALDQLALLLAVHDLNVHVIEDGQDLVQLGRGDHVRGKGVVDLFDREKSLVLAHVN